MDNRLNLGDRARDRITGFVGVVVGNVTYISGCDQVLLAPPVKDGDFKRSEWFDVDRCELVEAGVFRLEEVSNRARPGADAPAPRR